MDVNLEEKTSESMQAEDKAVESVQAESQNTPEQVENEMTPEQDNCEKPSCEENMPDATENADEVNTCDGENSSEETEANPMDSVLQAISTLTDKVDQLGKQFDAKIMHTTHEEKIVDQMHSELQRYKEDMYSQLVRPILMDIIEVRDSIMRMSKTFSERPEAEQVVPLKTFSDYAFDVQDILEKNNITIYRSNEGDTFTPIKQRVIKKVNTPVEELHGKVAESLSDGYEYLGKTISPERIAIYVCEETENKEGEAK